MTVFEKNMIMLENKLIEKRAKQYMSNPEALEQFKLTVASSGRRNDQLVLNKILELESMEQNNSSVKKLELRSV